MERECKKPVCRSNRKALEIYVNQMIKWVNPPILLVSPCTRNHVDLPKWWQKVLYRFIKGE